MLVTYMKKIANSWNKLYHSTWKLQLWFSWHCQCVISDKCDFENYIVEKSNMLRFTLNNHKMSIRYNSRGFQLAVHLKQNDNSQRNMRCVILRVDIKTTDDRLTCEQAFIRMLKTFKKCKSRSAMSIAESYIHMCWQLLTSTSINNTEVDVINCVTFFSIRNYRQYAKWERIQEWSIALVALFD